MMLDEECMRKEDAREVQQLLERINPMFLNGHDHNEVAKMAVGARIQEFYNILQETVDLNPELEDLLEEYKDLFDDVIYYG